MGKAILTRRSGSFLPLAENYYCQKLRANTVVSASRLNQPKLFYIYTTSTIEGGY